MISDYPKKINYKMHAEILINNLGSFLIFAGISFFFLSLIVSMISRVDDKKIKSEMDNFLTAPERSKVMFFENKEMIEQISVSTAFIRVCEYVRKNFINFSIVAVLFMCGAFVCMWSMIVNSVELAVISVIWILIVTGMCIAMLWSILDKFREEKGIFLMHFNNY
ncbi:MAG: hypothetical protein CVT89_07350 [Candidatus Altiarchaeales archaeon HGW-Altiarchaeales-2]|nr:MAG: hypothetical protein CVT89_07350 [Candidatus Altiarchaeales archaeon HGW-Altiarchaeales-2]